MSNMLYHFQSYPFLWLLNTQRAPLEKQRLLPFAGSSPVWEARWGWLLRMCFQKLSKDSDAWLSVGTMGTEGRTYMKPTRVNMF